jgi:CRP-like cAMP-binding protein
MEANTAVLFYVWGLDSIAYGPVELPLLVSWVRDGRVLSNSWVYRDDQSAWVRAGELSELKLFFASKPAGGAAGEAGAAGITPGSLRRIKILAEMEERQLASLLQYLEVVKLLPHATLFRKGEHGDAMFMVLEGEVRARVLIEGRESTLSTMTAGECFGEIAVIDQGPRSADVVTNVESVLLKVSASALQRLFQEAPALAAPLLLALSRTITGRLRTLTKRYEDTMRFKSYEGELQAKREGQQG